MIIEKKTNFENFPVTTERFKKTIVITGGSGFIGSNLIRAFNDIGFSDIIIVDGLGGDDKWKNIRGLKYRDIMLPEEFISWASNTDLESVDAVIHLGASTDTTDRDADRIMVNNYTFSKGLYELCASTETRFIYASSAATYGDGSKGYSDAKPVGEYDNCALNPYAYSKQLLDKFVFNDREDDNSTVGLKFFNVYGPNEGHKEHMASVISQNISSDEISLFKMPEGKKAVRDFIYVKDVVAIIIKIYKNDKINGIYNVGTGEPRSWEDLANAIFSARGKSPSISYTDMPEAIKGHYQYYTCADTTRLLSTIGDFKFTSLEDGIKDYVNETC